MIFLNKKVKYYAWIMSKSLDGYNRIHKRRISPSKERFRYKRKYFEIDIESYSFKLKNKKIYLFNLADRIKLTYFPYKPKVMDLSDYDEVMDNQLIEALSNDLDGSTQKINWFTHIIVLALGIFGGFFIFPYL